MFQSGLSFLSYDYHFIFLNLRPRYSCTKKKFSFILELLDGGAKRDISTAAPNCSKLGLASGLAGHSVLNKELY